MISLLIHLIRAFDNLKKSVDNINYPTLIILLISLRRPSFSALNLRYLKKLLRSINKNLNKARLSSKNLKNSLRSYITLLFILDGIHNVSRPL
jgi:hypothetical protein